MPGANSARIPVESSARRSSIRYRPYRRRSISPEVRTDYETLLARHLDGVTNAVPSDLVGYLDFLAGLKRFVFHGSNRPDIEELSIERESGDSRAFGRQEAVFATSDPHWAALFAMVARENTSRLRNGSFAFSSAARTRWYRRDIVLRDPDGPLLGEGSLYVLPRDTFHAEPKVFGIIDNAQWASPLPVTPLFSLRFGPKDYSLSRHIRAISD